MTTTFPNSQSDGTPNSRQDVEISDTIRIATARALSSNPASDETKRLLDYNLKVKREERDHELRIKQADLRFKRQVYGLIIGMFAILAGSATAIWGAVPLSTGFIGTGGVIGLVALFVRGK